MATSDELLTNYTDIINQLARPDSAASQAYNTELEKQKTSDIANLRGMYEQSGLPNAGQLFKTIGTQIQPEYAGKAASYYADLTRQNLQTQADLTKQLYDVMRGNEQQAYERGLQKEQTEYQRLQDQLSQRNNEIQLYGRELTSDERSGATPKPKTLAQQQQEQANQATEYGKRQDSINLANKWMDEGTYTNWADAWAAAVAATGYDGTYTPPAGTQQTQNEVDSILTGIVPEESGDYTASDVELAKLLDQKDYLGAVKYAQDQKYDSNTVSKIYRIPIDKVLRKNRINPNLASPVEIGKALEEAYNVPLTEISNTLDGFTSLLPTLSSTGRLSQEQASRLTSYVANLADQYHLLTAGDLTKLSSLQMPTVTVRYMKPGRSTFEPETITQQMTLAQVLSELRNPVRFSYGLWDVEV